MGNIQPGPPIFVDFSGLSYAGKITGTTIDFPLRANICFPKRLTPPTTAPEATSVFIKFLRDNVLGFLFFILNPTVINSLLNHNSEIIFIHHLYNEFHEHHPHHPSEDLVQFSANQ